jgi:hypothetical protein
MKLSLKSFAKTLHGKQSSADKPKNGVVMLNKSNFKNERWNYVGEKLKFYSSSGCNQELIVPIKYSATRFAAVATKCRAVTLSMLCPATFQRSQSFCMTTPHKVEQKAGMRGRPVDRAEAQRTCPALVSAAEVYFGSWGKALHAAGIDPNLYFVHHTVRRA